jgi:ATP-dependent protease ClpP protease subunit
MNIRKPYADLFKERLRAAATLTVQNRDGADGPAVIRIYGIIDDWFGISAEQVAAELEQITADEIEVQINSVGGSVFEGVAIFNALRAHPAKITTRVDGMAASIASVIVQAGDRRIMLTGSQMMIHEALAITIGNGEDHRKTGEILDVQTSIIAGIYAERSDTDADEWLALMAEETWFDHDGAVKAGLADEAVKPSRQPEDRVPSKFAADLEALRRWSPSGQSRAKPHCQTMRSRRSTGCGLPQNVSDPRPRQKKPATSQASTPGSSHSLKELHHEFSRIERG